VKSSFVDVNAVDRAMLDRPTRFSLFYFCQSLYTLQSGLPAIAGLLVRQ